MAVNHKTDCMCLCINLGGPGSTLVVLCGPRN